MPEQWYWKHGRHLLGPMETAQLEQLVDEHRIADRDQLRLSEDETWLSGAEVKRLFAESGASSSSEAAARLLSQARKLQDREVAPQTGSIEQFWKATWRIARNAGGPMGKLTDVVSSGLQAVVRRLTLRFLLVFLAAAVAIIFALQLEFGGASRLRRVHAELVGAWSELQQLQSRDTSESEWRVFAESRRPTVELVLKSLIRDAERAPGRSTDSFAWLRSAERGWREAHTRNALVHAAQALIAMLDNPSASGQSLSAEIFQEHMTIADGLLRQPAVEAVVSSTGPAGGAGTDGWPVEVTAIVAVDVVLLAVGVWWWRRR